MLERHLALAEQHVAQGEEHIARQREIIAKLESGAHATDKARTLLDQFLDVQALHVAHRDRLQEELAQARLQER